MGLDFAVPLNIGLLGAGRASQILHAPALLQVSNQIRSAAIFDANDASAQALSLRFSAVQVAGTAEELFDSPDFQAIAALAPLATHAPSPLPAVRAGKHLLIEETLSNPRCRRIRAKSRSESRGRVCRGRPTRFA